MSLTAADRAPKRAPDLMDAILDPDTGWLASDDTLLALLERDSTAYGTAAYGQTNYSGTAAEYDALRERVVPQGIAKRMWDDSAEGIDPQPVTVAVAAWEVGSTRNNLRDEKRVVADIQIAATYGFAESNPDGTRRLSRIQRRVEVLLSEHREGWTAAGVTGGTNQFLPDANNQRYIGATRLEFSRDDLHETHA